MSSQGQSLYLIRICPPSPGRLGQSAGHSKQPIESPRAPHLSAKCAEHPFPLEVRSPPGAACSCLALVGLLLWEYSEPVGKPHGRTERHGLFSRLDTATRRVRLLCASPALRGSPREQPAPGGAAGFGGCPSGFVCSTELCSQSVQCDAAHAREETHTEEKKEQRWPGSNETTVGLLCTYKTI